MTNRNPDLSYDHLDQLLDFWFWQYAKRLHTFGPGMVREYDPETKRAAVQVALNMLVSRDGDMNNLSSMARPVIQDVPVCWPSSGGYVQIMPVRSGDMVMVFFSERGIEAFKETFEVSDPTPDRIMSEIDAVAVPGFGALRITPATTTGAAIQTEDGTKSVRIEEDRVEAYCNGSFVRVEDGMATIDASVIVLRGANETWRIP